LKVIMPLKEKYAPTSIPAANRSRLPAKECRMIAGTL